jgi:hypothetical protein
VRFRWMILAVVLVGCLAGAGQKAASAAPEVTAKIVGAPGASSFSSLAALPLPTGQGSFGSVAGAAQTLAATTSSLTDPGHPGLSAYAFGLSPSGWSSSTVPAQLDVPDPTGVGVDIAATNDLVAVGDGVTTAQGGEEASVFTRPAAGWSGSLDPTATLDSTANAVAPGDVPPYEFGEAPLAAAADTVFIGAGSTVDVFAEPASGWSGSLQPGATLQVPAGVGVQEVAASGRTAVAEQGRALYVFDEPATGWSGALAPNVVLTLPEPEGNGYPQSLAIGASAIAAESVDGDGSVFVFVKPTTGWRSSSSPARLSPPPLGDSGGFATTAIASRTVVLLEAALGSDHTCGCSDTLWAATPTASGWPPRTELRIPGTDFGGDGALTAVGGDVAATYDDDELMVYAPSTPPSVARARLSVAGAHPRLELTLGRGTRGSELRWIAVHLKGGLYVRSGGVAGIDLSGRPAHATYGRHTIEIEIADPNRGTAGLDVTVGQNSLRMTASLSRRIAALAHKRRATVRIPIVVKLEDQARRSRHATITFAAR